VSCADCGRASVVYMTSNVARRCRQCYRGVKGDEAVAPLAKRCNFCSMVVATATAPYIKTRDAYYCDENCQKEERCLSRAKKKDQKSNRPLSEAETTPLATAFATGGKRKLPWGAQTSPELGSLESSPETSKTASFDRDGIGGALRGSGVDLPDGDVDACETEPGRWLISMTVGRLSRQAAGPRVVAREYGKWRVQKAKEVHGNFELDPLGGAA